MTTENFSIDHVIYSAHLSDDGDESTLRRVGEAYGEAVAVALRNEFPDAPVQVQVVHGVQGVGAGTTIHGEYDRAIEERIGATIDRVEVPEPWEPA